MTLKTLMSQWQNKMPSGYIHSAILALSLILGSIYLSSCSSYPSLYTYTAEENSSSRSELVSFARNQIGDSYLYAAKGPDKFDCSGLVSYVYNAFNIIVSGSAASISKQGKEIHIKNAKAGDLVFFKREGSIFHVSIITYSDDDSLSVVHSTTSKGVIEENILASAYWKPMIHKIISLESIKK